MSDICGAIKPHTGVGAGDGDSEAKKQELESEELQSKKLAAYNKQINEQLENHSIQTF